MDNKEHRTNALHRLKQDIRVLCQADALTFVLVGSYGFKDDPPDLDIAVIVDENVDFYSFVRNISPILARYTIELDILVTCFPIRQSDYLEPSSQFIRNIHKYGHKF